MDISAKRERPPADNILNEIFFDQKCGKNDTHDLFFGWCSRAPLNQRIKTMCEGIGGVEGLCDFDSAFVDTPNPTIDNITDYVLPTNDVPPYPAKLPEYIFWRNKCKNGPGKITNDNGTERIDPTIADQIILKCRQEMYGVQGLPLWLMLLIIFLVLTAVTVSAGLFWKFYIKKRYFSPQRSTKMGSQWTSAPFLSKDEGSRFSTYSLKRSSALPIGSSQARRSGESSAIPIGSSQTRLISGRSSAVPIVSSNMKVVSGQSSAVPIGSSNTRVASGQSSAVPMSGSSTKVNSMSRAPSVTPSVTPSGAPSKASRETSRRSRTPSIRSSSAFKP